ncbi:MAG: mechanosensitive ion channel family protein [Chlamydiales bacterium]|nr:mechanosensitive ion channel family protein [Chlamydiia bacterium]MCP5508502.1 mechanosensitive ion channel family protein [Chlamydiales bacterium]
MTILIVTAILGYLVRKGARKLAELSENHIWMQSLGEALELPSIWIIWGYGILLVIETITKYVDFSFPRDAVFKAEQVLLMVGVFWIIFSWKNKVEKLYVQKAKHKETSVSDLALISGVGKLSSVVLIVVFGFMVLDALEVPITTLIAFGGLGSLAVSWAAKDVIANFFGGMMIYINRPFTEGDWIKSPNKGFEGVVEEIGWYMTRIRTFERRPTYIPNAVITDAIIENPGRMYNRRIKTSIGLRYEDVKCVGEVAQRIKQMLMAHPGIDQKQLLFVDFVDFGPYSLNIEVYTFTKTTRWGEYRAIQQDVLLKIANIVEACGAKIAFPTNTVHLKDNN